MVDKDSIASIAVGLRARLEEVAHGADVRAREEALDYAVLAAEAMFKAGQHHEANEFASLVISASADGDWGKSAEAQFRALGVQAQVSVVWGALEEAGTAFEEALQLAGQTDRLREAPAVVPYSLALARVFQELGRDADAVETLHAALIVAQTARDVDQDERDRRLTLVCRKLMHTLLRLKRFTAAQDVGATLSTLLSDPRPIATVVPAEPTEEALACTLASVLSSIEADTFSRISGPGLDRSAMASEAVRLYNVTQPWTVVAQKPEAVTAAKAAALLRRFADGFALLSALPLDQGAQGLPLLDVQTLWNVLYQSEDIQDWASRYGHPLTLPALRPDSRLLQSETSPTPVADDGALVQLSMEVLLDYDLLVLRFAAFDDASLWHESTISEQGAAYIERATRMMDLMAHTELAPERLVLAMVCLLCAQSLFVLSRRDLESSPVTVFGDDELRTVLRESGALEWVSQRGAAFPSWALTAP